jgi:hypothetical protein
MRELNIAYDDVLVYDVDGNILFPNSNLKEYDYHPWHVLNSERLPTLSDELGISFPYNLTGNEDDEFNYKIYKLASLSFSLLFNSHINFFQYKIDDISKTDKQFIYPIILYDNQLFEKYETVELNPNLVKCLKDGTAKLCFIQHTEGFFGMNNSEIIWVHNLCKKYGLHKNNVFFITSNFKSVDTYNELLSMGIISDLYEIIPYSFFQYNVWFDNVGVIANNNKVEFIKNKRFYTFLENNRTNKKPYHFLSFNRLPKPHRVCIFSQIMVDSKLKDISILSMGGSSYENQFYNDINQFISDDYKFSKEKLLDFLKNYDNTKHYVYDYDDLENNKAESLNIHAHSNSFVNIITESLFQNNSIFFSEKTYKPIYIMQPFILFGNPGSLKKLKELGFKTFDRWWDESYDDEPDFTKRFEKIIELLYTISEWSIDELYSKTQEMEEVLVHNFNTMMNYNYFDIIYDKLSK